MSQALSIQCFFGSNSGVEPLSQVQYLYGVGTSPNSISADLVSLYFGLGSQVSFGSSLTSNSTATSASTAPGQQAPSQAVAQLQAGGDFYLKGTYPLFFRSVGNKLTLFVFNPKLGFNFSGFGSQSTITEATEFNWNASVEGYQQIKSLVLPNQVGGVFYVDARGGLQGVQATFARAVGLGEKTEFPMAQIGVGIAFKGFLRIGLQKFFGPSQLYSTAAGTPATTQNDFKKVHVVLQLAPN